MLDIESPTEMAHAYAAHGWAVVPLHTAVDGKCDCRTECGSPAKHPRTIRGFKDASTDAERVAKWWSIWPHANIGIVTGKESGIVVIDIDPRNGGMDTVEALRTKGHELRRTAQVLTQSGGFHLYYRYPEGARQRGHSLGAGIDIKGDGGYVVAPPSIGIDGQYVWQVAMSLEEM